MPTQAKPFLTPEQYLEIESKAECRSEYYNGEMFLMAGNVRDHVLITGNLGAAFRHQFRNRSCNVYTSEIKVRVLATGLYTYPDVIAICGDEVWQSPSRTILLNPAVIVEVLSDCTEAYDRGDKFWHYRQIPSPCEYILVSAKIFRVEQFIRQPDGEFKLRTYDSIDDTLEIPAVACSIPLREIYLKTELLS